MDDYITVTCLGWHEGKPVMGSAKLKDMHSYLEFIKVCEAFYTDFEIVQTVIPVTYSEM